MEPSAKRMRGTDTASTVAGSYEADTSVTSIAGLSAVPVAASMSDSVSPVTTAHARPSLRHAILIAPTQTGRNVLPQHANLEHMRDAVKSRGYSVEELTGGATSTSVIAAIGEAVQSLIDLAIQTQAPNATLIIYVSTHGERSRSDSSSWMTDVHMQSSVHGDTFTLQQLVALGAVVAAVHMIVILDVCSSGMASRDKPRPMLSSRSNVTLIAGCSSDGFASHNTQASPLLPITGGFLTRAVAEWLKDAGTIDKAISDARLAVEFSFTGGHEELRTLLAHGDLLALQQRVQESQREIEGITKRRETDLDAHINNLIEALQPRIAASAQAHLDAGIAKLANADSDIRDKWCACSAKFLTGNDLLRRELRNVLQKKFNGLSASDTLAWNIDTCVQTVWLHCFVIAMIQESGVDPFGNTWNFATQVADTHGRHNPWVWTLDRNIVALFSACQSAALIPPEFARRQRLNTFLRRCHDIVATWQKKNNSPWTIFGAIDERLDVSAVTARASETLEEIHRDLFRYTSIRRGAINALSDDVELQSIVSYLFGAVSALAADGVPRARLEVAWGRKLNIARLRHMFGE